jgi:type IV pilus assembly protein PilM
MDKVSKLLIGIDIGEYAIKAVKVEKTAESARILDFVIKEGVYSGPTGEVDSNAIKEVVAKLGAEGAHIHCVISGQNIVVKYAIVPFMPKEELRDAVRWSLKEAVNFNLDESTIDFQIVGSLTGTDGIKRNEVLSAAVHTPLINKQAKLFQDSGLELSSMTISHFALAHFVAQNERIMQGKINVVIDIGFKKTTLLIFKGTMLKFIRQLSSAGESFTKALSGVVVTFPKRIEFDALKAEQTKRKCGIPLKQDLNASFEDVPLAQVSVLMRPVLERLLADIRGSFKYFREEFQVETIDQVFLVGGGARLNNLIDFVKEGLGGIGAQIMPLPNSLVSAVPDVQGFQDALPSLMVSIGACLGPDTAINLVPRSVKIQKSISIQQRVLQLVGMLMLLVVPYTFGLLLVKEARYKRILVSYNDYYSNLVKLRTLRDNVVKRQQFFNAVIGQEPNLFIYLKELSRVVPRSVEFGTLDFIKSDMAFNIGGAVYAVDISAEKTLAAFMLDLESSPYFSDVNLVSSKKETDEKAEMINFILTVKLVKIK